MRVEAKRGAIGEFLLWREKGKSFLVGQWLKSIGSPRKTSQPVLKSQLAFEEGSVPAHKGRPGARRGPAAAARLAVRRLRFVNSISKMKSNHRRIKVFMERSKYEWSRKRMFTLITREKRITAKIDILRITFWTSKLCTVRAMYRVESIYTWQCGGLAYPTWEMQGSALRRSIAGCCKKFPQATLRAASR